MKRSPRTVFDDSGTKWYQSPLYKEGKIGEVTPEATTRIREEYVGDPTKLVRDRFYDFFQRVTRQGEPRIDTEELNKSLTIKVDELPDSTKIQDIFERLNSKVALNSKGKKNWSEEETTFFIWVILTYCDLNKYDYQDLNDSDWDYLASLFPGKKSDQCKVRWQGLLKVNLSRAPWSQKEDDVLGQIISEKGGTKKWKEIALELNQRCGNTKFFRQGKQCRERWINHLDPTINRYMTDRGVWTHQEDIKLLEAHLEVGKKWAEIAKRLKSRTENSVKNRWNSLMKKYKTDIDSDTMSSKSGYSDNSAMEDIEKKIAAVIISEKKRELTFTNTPSRISEVPEEEYLSDNDDTLQTSTQISNNPFGDEEDKEESTTKTTGSVSKKKSGGIIDVNKSKNALRNLVSMELDIKQQQNTQKTTLPSQNPSYMNSSTNNVLFPQGITQIQGNPIFGNSTQPSNQILGSTNGFLNFSKPPPTTNTRPTPKQPVDTSPGLFNRPGGNFNNQNNPMNNLFSVPGDMLNLNLLMMNQNNVNLYNSEQVQENSQNLQRGSGSLEYLGEIKTDEEKVFKFVEKSPESFNPGDFSNLHYAAVDMNQGFIYFISPMTKDNFPPPFTQPNPGSSGSIPIKGTSNNKIGSTGNVDFIMASPHLGSVNFSPNPFNSNLINLVKNQFSPGVNFFNESPGMDPRFINPDQRINSWNNEWTPETPSRPITIDANKMKQANLLWGNQFHRSSPEQRMMLNNSALMARQQQMFQLQGMNVERKKEDSPGVFLDTNQKNLLFQTKQLI